MKHHKPQHHEAPCDAQASDSQAQPSPQGEPQPQTAEKQPAQARGELEAVARLQEELRTAKDRELRCHAELDNFRKRAARELEERSRYADMAILRDLLPVLDNIERAIQAADQSADAGALLDGFKMVQQQLQDVLKGHECKQIEALHQPFDPNVHHAVLQQPSDEFPANTVLMVTQNGYQLHDRVVRPSQVIVSTTK